MQAVILKGDAVLGTGIVQHLDPPMGVALGPFTPSERFRANLHANTIDGEYEGDKGADFIAIVDDAPVQTASVALEDYSQSLGEYRFVIWFREEREYEPLFRNHPEFKSYYREDR